MPAVWKVGWIDFVMMPFGARAIPAFARAGNVKQRLAVPSVYDKFGRLFDRQIVLQAAVMMHVIYGGSPMARQRGSRSAGV